MSTHTDGASPSVGSSDDEMEPDPSPPRPREPGAEPPRPEGRRAGRRAASEDDEPGRDPGWVQQEIQRRIAERGRGDAGRHSRTGRDPAPGAGPTGAAEEPSDTPAEPPAPSEPTVSTASATATERPARQRSLRTPDPYSPDGMRDAPTEDGTPTVAEEPVSTANGAAPAKQWPPVDGAAGLPRRVPGAGWTLNRSALLGETDTAVPAGSETRPVPSLWASDVPPQPSAVGERPEDRNGHAGVLDYVDDDDLDDDLDDDDDGPVGLTGDTEVIWRAPGLDEPSPALAAAPSSSPGGDPGPAPYTGARPRRFAVTPTAAATEETLETAETAEQPAVDAPPQGKRVRVVLAERRATAHTVRTVVDVQDPGTVGQVLRSSLVNNQLGLALRVGGVALLGLGLLPALFAAFPSIGEVSVLGIRLPWLVLGFLVYPFLMLLGWWFTGSAERVEQEFVQDVQDR